MVFSYTEEYEGVITTREDSISIFSDLDVVYTEPNQLASGFGIDLGSMVGLTISYQLN